MTASATDIINRTKRLISMPADDTLFQEQDYIDFINDILMEKVYPRLMKIRDDYHLIRQVFNLQNSEAQDLYPTGVIPIPSRAWGNTLREVRYIDVSGNYYKVNPYFLADVDLYQTRNLAFSSSYQKGYIPFNSGIKLIPPPLQDNGSIEMHYIVTPSVVTGGASSGGNYATFTNMQFNSNTNVAIYVTDKLTVNGYLDSLCPEGSQGIFDIYNSQTGMLLASDLLLSRLGDVGDTSTFSGLCTVQTGTDIIDPNITELSNFQMGGFPLISPYVSTLYLVQAGANPFTPVPPPLDNLLIYEMAIKIMSAQGYVEELQIFMTEHADMRKDILSQMAMRVDCEPNVISNKRGIRQAILYGPSRNRGYRR